MNKNKIGWYVGRRTYSDGSVEYLEAVNGGPFRTIAGARKSLSHWRNKIDIVELEIVRKVGEV